MDTTQTPADESPHKRQYVTVLKDSSPVRDIFNDSYAIARQRDNSTLAVVGHDVPENEVVLHEIDNFDSVVAPVTSIFDIEPYSSTALIPYICELCDNLFTTVFDLEEHRSFVHINRTPIDNRKLTDVIAHFANNQPSCDLCGQQCTPNEIPLDHQVQHRPTELVCENRTHEIEVCAYGCILCDAIYESRRSLHMHYYSIHASMLSVHLEKYFDEPTL